MNQLIAWLSSNRLACRFQLVLKRAACIVFGSMLVFGAGESWAQSPVYQAAEWAKIVAAARKEGKVVYYIAQAVGPRIAAGFKKAYPDIELEYFRGSGTALLTKIEQERSAGLDGADAWSSTEIGWATDRAAEGGLLKPAGPALVGWPSQHVLEGTVVLLTREPIIMLYNKNQVKNPPKTYADLLKPEYQGRIGTSELAATLLIAWYDWLDKTQGPDYLTKLRALNPKLYAGSVPLAQAVASGELAVSAFGIPNATAGLIEKGAPIGMVVPSPAFGTNHIGAAFRWSKRPNAALVLLDWLMSAEGQAAWVGDGEVASARPGIPRSMDFASINAWDIKNFPPEIVKKYQERWNKVFK